MKYYARSFLPWIVLAVGSGVDSRIGVLGGLCTSVALLAADRWAERLADEMILDLSTAGFMAVFTALALVLPESPLLDYGAALAMGWLAATAWSSLAARRPFTLGIARRAVSADIARLSALIRINTVVTMMWALCFTCEAASLAYMQSHAPHNILALVACKVGLVAVAATFTARYPEYARRRAIAAAFTTEQIA